MHKYPFYIKTQLCLLKVISPNYCENCYPVRAYIYNNLGNDQIVNATIAAQIHGY